jgi:tRNA (guanine37-N1)-methyltransferase
MDPVESEGPQMQFDVFTLLPEAMRAYLSASVLGKAQDAGRIKVRLHNIRDYSLDRHRTTDDVPYGGGGGMIMKPEPIFRAVESVLMDDLGRVPVILMTPQGRPLNHEVAAQLSGLPRLALLCGRYEGVDERVRVHLVDDEISIGDYVLTGGELPALVLIDAVSRLLPGVLGDEVAPMRDSHAQGLLEYPHYTRPAEFREWRVPEVLRSGDHGRIAAWRRRQALLRTLRRRPDLLEGADLTEEERAWLKGVSLPRENGEERAVSNSTSQLSDQQQAEGA